MTSILCIFLKQWAIDRRKRHWPQVSESPIALIETSANRQTIAVACDKLRQWGVWRGMALAEARALCPALVDLPHEPHKDLGALEALGRWMMRFSPVVALDPPDGLLLEVGGCERLFGGLENLLARVRSALRRMNLSANAAIAPTAGAAWAIAHSGGDGTILAPEDLFATLAPLPTRALRIDVDVADMLAHLGIESIGQLIDLPRQTLPARFGPELLMRIDQALGRIPEPLTALIHSCPIEAAMEIDGQIDSLEAIEWILGQLLRQVLEQLIPRGLGARRMDVQFSNPHRPAIQKLIQLSRPSQDPRNLFNLLRCALETIKTRDGFSAIRLSIPLTQRMADEQITLMGGEKFAAEKELAQLVERLRVRLGEEGIRQPRLVESHVPERAFQLAEAGTGPLELKSRVGSASADAGGDRAIFSTNAALNRAASASAKADPTQCAVLPPPRPLHLLPTPLEVRMMVSPSDDREGRPVSFTWKGKVHRITHCAGPERIGGCWWDGHNKTRDYFDAEDVTGRRFWLFRVVQNGRWFVQGGWE